jgi:dihydrofolate reductase
MRKISAGLLISLDGVVESPDRWGWARYMNDEMTRGIMAGVAEADAVLMGRHTYEQFAEMWPNQGSEVPMADFLNHSPKYVVSTKLRGPLKWQGSTLLTGDLAVALTRLKELPGKTILIPGSPMLVSSLLRLGLLDELNLNICPLVVGAGRRLFEGVEQEISLELVRSVVNSNGVIGATYQRADGPSASEGIAFPAAAKMTR